MIDVLDCTLRDGSYAIDFQFTIEDTQRVASGLAKAGVRQIEVAHGVGLGGRFRRGLDARASDEAYIEAAVAAAPQAQIGAFFIPTIGTLEQMRQASRSGLRFIRIGTNVTEVALGERAVHYAKELGLTVSYNFMKTYAVSLSAFLALCQRVDRWGVDTLCIVDSAGCMLPDEVQSYIRGVTALTATPVGFHGHNNLQMAVANSMAAVEAGASLIDGTLRGMGRSAGNAQTELLVALLQRKGHLHAVDLFALMDLAETLVLPLMPRLQGVSDLEMITGLARFHSSFLPQFAQVAEEAGVDLRELILAVCEQDCIRPDQALIEGIAARLKPLFVPRGA